MHPYQLDHINESLSSARLNAPGRSRTRPTSRRTTASMRQVAVSALLPQGSPGLARSVLQEQRI